MSSELIVTLCTAGGALGGAFGAWLTVRIQVALHGQRLQDHEKDIDSLVSHKDDHAIQLSEHEVRIGSIERVIHR